MRYFGGKGQAGVYQRIISLMPPHEVYIETHLGGGNILERKKPAKASIAIDADGDLIALWRARGWPSTTFIHGDAAGELRRYSWTGRELVYCDPPYVMATRRSGPRYRYEYTDRQHRELLDVLRGLPVRVMISGYRCALYDALIGLWKRIDFPVMTRGHTWAMESLWLNFEPLAHLHDYRYLGSNFRERERIKRQQKRWRARLTRLPASERMAMLQVLLELASSEMALPDPAPDLAVGAIATDPLAVCGDAYMPASSELALLEREHGA